MTVVAWYEIVVGVAILCLWSVLLATRQVPEIPAGDRAIWFHLTAEAATAALLIAAGIVLLGDPASTTLSGVALGALLYTTITSPGYYAARDDWAPVAMFAVLVAATIAAIVAVLTAA